MEQGILLPRYIIKHVHMHFFCYVCHFCMLAYSNTHFNTISPLDSFLDSFLFHGAIQQLSATQNAQKMTFDSL